MVQRIEGGVVYSPVSSLFPNMYVCLSSGGEECGNEERPLISGRPRAQVSGQGHLPNAKAR
jgi:hypothetical protein